MARPELPVCVILEHIVKRLENAKDLAIAQLVSKDWLDACNTVPSVRIICLDVYHEMARNGSESGGGESSSSSQDTHGEKSKPLIFKEQCVNILRNKHHIVQLRIEVEPLMQAKIVPEDERRRTDFWLTDPWFLRRWLPTMKSTLQHLCIVDYGQQAILRRSPIIKILSTTCKLLKTLDLKNMYIDTSDCEEMNMMASLKLRFVKVVGEALQHINDKMPKLQTLALLGVFGAERGDLTFQDMKVLCLGLSTPATSITMNLPKLEKVQLKMQCPRSLVIKASNLKYVAFNLEVMEPSKVELKCSAGLQELLYGTSSFITLSSLMDKNPNMKKIFLDIPCMALGEDGRFLELPCMALVRDGRYLDFLNDIPVNLPSFSRLHECNDGAVSNTPAGRLRYQWNGETPNGLNLLMSESTDQ